MNFATSNGKIHAVSGKRTRCKVRVRPHWQPTEDELTCAACYAAVYGPVIIIATPVIEPEPPKSLAVSDDVDEMLSQLNSRIVAEHGGTCTVEVLPGTTVDVPRDRLWSWCANRITSRLTHKGKALRCSSGGGMSISDRPIRLA